jgi:surface polysaccharide O-acyltransferase-like enzyme
MQHHQPRIAWVDFIRSLSVFFVVLIHTAGPISYEWGEISIRDWMTGNAFSSFSRFSVSLLFMVSGYLLLNKREDLASFFRNRLLKVLLPFLGWSVVYLVWEHGYRDFSFFNALKAIVYAISTTPAAYHMWFLYELLYIYLFTPVLRVFVQAADRAHLWYFAGIWFLMGPVLIMIERMVGLELIVNLGFITQYVGFFFLGHLLGNTSLPRNFFVTALVVYFLSGLYTMYATFTLTSIKGASDQYYYWYDRINIVFMSISAFLLLKQWGSSLTSPRAIRIFEFLARTSFGIYLVHVLVLIYVKRAGLTVFSGPLIMTVPGISLLVWGISLVVVVILQRIPLVRRFVPY